ncbi:MAG: DUF5916 domain-containing protein [Saprospiraceae bacterium]|nr:DUF5916 domain-containing protein [Saprospiraceae bacterium]
MKNLLVLFLAFVLIPVCAQVSQDIDVNKITESIQLDGILDEEAWSECKVHAKDFFQYFPTDSILAQEQTTIRMAFDDENLYVGIECFTKGNNFVIPTLRRDFRAGGNDNITLLIDPFNDGINAFMFGTNPAGVQREGLISGAGTSLNGFSTSWDNKWQCETKIYEDKYVAEIAIPFSTLRFNKSGKQWRFNAYRFDMQTNERSTWINIPRNQWIFNLGYMGKLNFSEEIKATGSKFSLIPFGITSYGHNVEDNEDPEFTYNVGGDAKIAITSGLNLDLTINPDFSQVEVDRQVTNLSRFEISFPERRQFFLENADLFGSFGSGGINPFFSRRIGIVQDTATDENIQNTIYGGLRLSGKLNKKWRLGLLSMGTKKDDFAGQPDLNFSVATIQRNIGDRSNLGFILVNRQSIKPDNNDAIDKFNRVIGVDYNLATKSNLWAGKTFLHKSFSVNQLDKSFAHGLDLTYNKRKYLINWAHQYVGGGYDAQVGFVRRTNYYRIEPEFQYFFYPSNSPINRANLNFEFEQIWMPGNGRTDQEVEIGANIEFTNNSRFNFGIRKQYIYLFDEFDPTGTDSEVLAEDTEYTYYNFQANYNSDNSKRFSYRIRPFFGQYFNGMRYGTSGSINYRVEPFGSVSVNYNVNFFDMPYLDEVKSTVLLGPRFDFTFTKKIFLTAFFQYNSQSQNTNINTRFQWRFAPVSDFFLVYADNYFSGNPNDPSDRFAFNLRNRSIVAKVTYWLNM